MPTHLADDTGDWTPERARSRATLVILSDELTPDEVTIRLGLEADESWYRGEPTTWMRPRQHHGWVLGSGLDEARPAEDHVDALLQRADPSASAVSSLAGDPAVLSARLSVFRSGDNWNPGFGFGPSVIARLARLGVGLDIDVYVHQDEAGYQGEPPEEEHRVVRPT